MPSVEPSVEIVQEQPEDAAEIERLLDLAFGPDRLTKTAYRLREGVSPVPELCLVARENGVLRASNRFWPVRIGEGIWPALLLGPLAVDPEHRGRGLGIELMRRGLEQARMMGHARIILVGDEPYYARVGFSRAKAVGLALPGPVDERRLLALELVPGSFEGVSGMVHRAIAEMSAGKISATLAPPCQQ